MCNFRRRWMIDVFSRRRWARPACKTLFLLSNARQSRTPPSKESRKDEGWCRRNRRLWRCWWGGGGGDGGTSAATDDERSNLVERKNRTPVIDRKIVEFFKSLIQIDMTEVQCDARPGNSMSSAMVHLNFKNKFPYFSGHPFQCLHI